MTDDAKPLRYRINADPVAGFDEVVVHSTRPDEILLHAEMMSPRSIWVSVGDLCIWAFVNDEGRVEISDMERRVLVTDKEFREMTREMRPLLTDSEKLRAVEATKRVVDEVIAENPMPREPIDPQWPAQEPLQTPLQVCLKRLDELAASPDLPKDMTSALERANAVVLDSGLPAKIPSLDALRIGCAIGVVVAAAAKKGEA